MCIMIDAVNLEGVMSYVKMWGSAVGQSATHPNPIVYVYTCTCFHIQTYGIVLVGYIVQEVIYKFLHTLHASTFVQYECFWIMLQCA